MSIKTCQKCKIEKPLSMFGRDKKRKDGRIARCKVCRNAAAAARRAKKRAGGQSTTWPGQVVANQIWRENNATAWEAHQIIQKLKRKGIVKQEPCSRCGSEASEAHHENYALPGNVDWLCRACHRAEHCAMIDARISNTISKTAVRLGAIQVPRAEPFRLPANFIRARAA
jgi:hypothetical protein